MEKRNKERYWTFIMYPDSMVENWREILQETGVQVGISPLHDKDINADETQKKEHYHVLLCFKGPTTYKRVAELTEELNATIPKRVMSPVGMIRYFTHKDNPEKAQYNEQDITSINGFDVREFSGLSTSMIEQIKIGILDIIKINKIEEYAILIDYLKDRELWDMLEIASNKTVFFTAYLTSVRHRIK